jgi:hypothetical protein
VTIIGDAEKSGKSNAAIRDAYRAVYGELLAIVIEAIDSKKCADAGLLRVKWENMNVAQNTNARPYQGRRHGNAHSKWVSRFPISRYR